MLNGYKQQLLVHFPFKLYFLILKKYNTMIIFQAFIVFSFLSLSCLIFYSVFVSCIFLTLGMYIQYCGWDVFDKITQDETLFIPRGKCQYQNITLLHLQPTVYIIVSIVYLYVNYLYLSLVTLSNKNIFGKKYSRHAHPTSLNESSQFGEF